ncbi:MAG: cytochrome c biogenesis protein CcsA [Fluviicola sp.]|nr:cytochrome c biogenesis protein CcsA [Fluviicola sp.]
MEKLANALFSMRAMAVGLLIFLVAIARATFIESNENVQAAKLWIYNAKWFELLLVYLCISLIANIFRYQMWKREKIAILMFHLSFIVIIIGAGITRYFSFEGSMPIREGETSNIMYSADPYLWVRINDGKMQATNDTKAFMAESYWNNNADLELWLPNHKNDIQIEYVDFKSKHIDSLKLDPKYKTSALDIVTDGMKSNYVLTGEIFQLGNLAVAFSDAKVDGVNVFKKNGKLMIRPSMPMQFIPMKEMQKARQTGQMPSDSAYVRVAAGEEVPFATTTLYQIAGAQFVFKQEIPNAGRELVPSGKKDVGKDYLTVKITDGNQSKIVTLEGGMREMPTPEFFQFNGLNYHMEYGSKKIEIPFGMKCVDFQLDRYPGSSMASSFASILQVVDMKKGPQKERRIFMNHVMDYEGYRFFQSAYDQDEKGTILSVNHDALGTNVTYLGYLLMTIGMIMSLFAPISRFRIVIKKMLSSMNTLSLFLFTFLYFSLFGQNQHSHEHNHNHSTNQAAVTKQKPLVRFISKEHSDEVASLLVQDFNGRIVPLHTVCTDLLVKLNRSNKFQDRNAVQNILSMHMYPDHWVDQKVIYVPTALRERLKLNDRVSFREITANDGSFKWLNDYNAALRKQESRQSEYEKKLIKLGEKHQVFLGVVNWQYMKIIPLKGDKGNMWFMPFDQMLIQKDTLTSKLALEYISSLNKSAVEQSNYSVSNSLLKTLKEKQRSIAPASILPSETHVKVEVYYNKMNIFKNAERTYFLLGLILIIVFFVHVLGKSSVRFEKTVNIIRKILFGLMAFIFVYHGAGLGMRWYVSGHVPWSDGYEALVYIAFIVVLVGLLFARFHYVILGLAAILSGAMLMVSDLNLLDPQITPLQPVLKSYWLMIHVAIITASYAFLGLSCIIGLINLVLFVVRSNANGVKTNKAITTLSYVSEMTMTIGLFMLTIGTFLGGIWANESWGRYWGWDPKETWALVSVLVYAIIMHFRFLPGLKSKLAYNIAAFWGYTAILFTFFGVNFILVGLHSYANGDGAVNLPSYVWIMGIVFFLFTFIAIYRNYHYQKVQRNDF